MQSIVCDPNYDPESTYPYVDGLLLLSPTIHLFGPSARKMERVARTRPSYSVTPERMRLLIERRRVIPIGRESWWDESIRRREENQSRANGNLERAEVYEWTDFDAKIYESRQILPDDFPWLGEQLKATVPGEKPHQLARFVERTQELKNQERLPKQLLSPRYANWTPRQLAEQLLHMLGGDLSLAYLFDAEVFASDELGRAYEMVARELASADTARKKPIGNVAAPAKIDEDIRVAKEFTRLLMDKYAPLDVDLLDAYHQTSLPQLLRLFVREGLDLMSVRQGGLEGRGLMSLFEDAARQYELRQTPGAVQRLVPGGIAFVLLNHPGIQAFYRRLFDRREFVFRLATWVAGSALGPWLLTTASNTALPGRWDRLVEVIVNKRAPV